MPSLNSHNPVGTEQILGWKLLLTDIFVEFNVEEDARLKSYDTSDAENEPHRREPVMTLNPLPAKGGARLPQINGERKNFNSEVVVKLIRAAVLR